MKNKLLLALSFCTVLSTTAQEKPKWDVSEPALPYSEVKIETDEGTWMNVDVSPDGEQLVFDLLGDIYTMPISGGKAKLISGGHTFEVQPRFSPDGKKISFTSDRDGADNIWMMNTDGSDAEQITKEDFRLVNNAVWSLDGDYIICKKHFTSGRSLGAGEIWMYHTSGGKGIQLTKRKNDQQDVGEPWLSPDGKYVYFSEDMYPGGAFQYNKDPNSQIYVIKRYGLEDGKTETVTGGSGGAIRPVISHNGELMAFVRRIREKSVLFLHDLKTGREWPIYKDLSQDQQETWAVFGAFTGFNWTPDDKHIIVWAQGKIRKIEVGSGDASIIPFQASANHKIVNALRFKNDVAPDQFTAKAIRHAVTSPDGKLLVFNAAGYLWKKQLPDGKPERLTDGEDLAYDPSFSKDGSKLLYVSWNDVEMGAIHMLDLSNSESQKISTEKGIYRMPVFSPIDNDLIVFKKEGGSSELGYEYTKEPGIYILNRESKEVEKVVDGGDFPSFNKDGKRIYYQSGGLTKTLYSVNLAGEDKRELVKSKYTNRLLPSPDEKWVAFTNYFKVYIAAMPLTGQTLEIDNNTKSLPIAQLAKDAGINIHWSADSKKLHWTMGEEYFSKEINERFAFLPGAPDSLTGPDSTGLKIGLVLKADKPEGKIAFTNARIITMKNDKVIEKGTVLIDGNKILAVGRVSIPKDAKVIDASGKTIMPGLIDSHAHLGQFGTGLSPQKHWQYYANLAYGVTTAHDPSSSSELAFSQSEMVKTGTMVGPRLFTTGTILYGADALFKANINDLEDAKSAVYRTKAFGAFTVKSYNQPRRNQRQQVIKAAHDLKVAVVPEGGSTFFHNLTMVLDGHSSIEHNIPVAPLYNDVIKLWGASGTSYTPTLIVNYGAVNGEYYWYQNTNVWEDKKLLTFTPREIIDSRARHRTMIPMEEYENGYIKVSKSAKKLSDAGVRVNLGAHGQLQGLGVHWELWMLSQGGMTNMEALKTATTNGAMLLGMEEEIGSLEKGKLADLIVLDKNPLENIRNSNSVIWTMVNGRLYESNTLNEKGNYDKSKGVFFWEEGNAVLD
ncbi:amidohydrolase family protein [uncultured Arcticibacterium sp.]|uniref:amidohydrolase family protein n=1 Tax=uncultured Arcticibacterium sp. TaxID=2173042 RepID=UPI0030FA2BEC